MALYNKSAGANGPWVDKKQIKTGTKVKILTESTPTDDLFQGRPITRNIVKLKIQGEEGEPKNFDLNKPTINGLIEAFGEDSKAWIGKVLTAETMKVIVGGKMGIAMYLIPEGFELGTDAGGYVVVQRVNVAQESVKPEPHDNLEPVEYPTEHINPEDIPF